MNLGFRDRTNPLFFDKEKNMRLHQAARIGLLVYLLIFVPLIGLGILKYTVAGYSFLGVVFTALAIAFMDMDRAVLFSNSRVAGEVAKGIASAPAELVGNVLTDDERDPYWDYDHPGGHA